MKFLEISLNEAQSNDTPTETEESKNIVARTEVLGKDRLMGHPMDDQSTLSVWARKERKFKCDLCPSR